MWRGRPCPRSAKSRASLWIDLDVVDGRALVAVRDALDANLVAGPQLGYYYPGIVLEASLQGPGILAQGVLVPGGGPYVLIGRTADYAWSLTSASNDNRDQLLVELCEPDGSTPTRASRFYRHQGRCTAMDGFDAGTLDEVGDEFPYLTDPNAIARRDVPNHVEVYEINGPFFFGVADRLKDTLRSLERPPKVFILRMRYVPGRMRILT